MKRTFVLFLICVLLFCMLPTQGFAAPETVLKIGSSGSAVTSLQQRLSDLNYYSYRITDYFGNATDQAVRLFQQTNNLPVDGVVGPQTATFLYGDTVKPKKQEKLIIPTIDNATAVGGGSARIKPELLDWFKVAGGMFSRGETATIIDIRSGRRFNIRRKGGSNHADVEPVTKKDTATMKSIYGGSWSWNRRAVVIRLVQGGKTRYIAASMNGMPHGFASINGNNFNGHFCVHFLNSKTHIRNMRDKQHQSMVKTAAASYVRLS